MAATERKGRRRKARQRSRTTFRELPWIAAGIGALAARQARAQSTIDARFLYYKESGGRTQVLDPIVLIDQDLGSTWGRLGLVLGYDAISGASPSGGYPTADVTTSASGQTSSSGNVPLVAYNDHRSSVALSYGRRFGAHLPSVDLSYAKENDYTAKSVGLSDSWTMAGGRGTLHFGASFSRDIVAPVTNDLRLPKDTDGYALGWTWILGPRDLLDVSASYMRLRGYLDDPYKVVPIGDPGAGTTVPDHRPDSRARLAFFVKYGHSYTWDGALKLTYRYYRDDWSARAHTLDAVYDQHAGSDWIVSPRVRIYTQSAASFYTSLLAAPQEFRSADYRLSSFYSVLGGVSVTRKIDERLSVNLGATIQSQLGRDRVTPVATSPGAFGASSVSAADLNVFTLSAGLTFRY